MRIIDFSLNHLNLIKNFKDDNTGEIAHEKVEFRNPLTKKKYTLLEKP